MRNWRGSIATRWIFMLSLCCADLLALTGAGRAETDEEIFAYFRKTGPVGQQTLTAWKHRRITYILGGNLSFKIGPEISRLMQDIGHAADLDLEPGTPAAIAMLYDLGIFKDLRDRPERFLQSKIPPAIVEALRQQASDHGWNGQCLTISWTDPQGMTLGALILSKTNIDEKCLVPMIFDLFGLTGIKDKDTGLKNLCVLHAITVNGDRKATDARAAIAAKRADCGL